VLDHFAPAVARDDEASQVTTAEAKRAESHHDNELQQLAHRSNSGSMAIFTAIRRASSLVSSLGEGSASATGATGERALLAGLPIPKTRQHKAPFRAPVYMWMTRCVAADSGGKSVH